MSTYTLQDSHVHFRQSRLPILFFVVLGTLGVYIHLTGSKMYPYSVQLSESDFLQAIELAKEL